MDRLSDRLRHPPAVLTRALRFIDTTSEENVLKVVASLMSEGPFEYHQIPRASNPGALMPEWSFKLLVPRLEEQGIRFKEVKPIPVSGLPIEDQARIRGRQRLGRS